MRYDIFALILLPVKTELLVLNGVN